MEDDVEASTLDIGSSSVRLIRVGKVVQAYFSSSFQAGYWYEETARRSKRLEDSFRGMTTKLTDREKRALSAMADAAGEPMEATAKEFSRRRALAKTGQTARRRAG